MKRKGKAKKEGKMNNNCNHQNESGNFCSQCGVALKEKCPECGQMEKIGRPVCKTKLTEALKARDKALLKLGEWRENLLVMIAILIPVFCLTLSAIKKIHPLKLAEFMILLTFPFIAIIIGVKWQSNVEKKSEGKFLAENPGHAEILKQAEVDGNK